MDSIRTMNRLNTWNAQVNTILHRCKTLRTFIVISTWLDGSIRINGTCMQNFVLISIHKINQDEIKMKTTYPIFK